MQNDPSSDHKRTGTSTDDRVRRAADFLEGLMQAVGNNRVSFAALGILVRLADEDSQQMTVHALAAERCPNDERQVLDALSELQCAGHVRLEDADADDQPQSITAYLIHA